MRGIMTISSDFDVTGPEGQVFHIQLYNAVFVDRENGILRINFLFFDNGKELRVHTLMPLVFRKPVQYVGITKLNSRYYAIDLDSDSGYLYPMVQGVKPTS